MSRILPRRRASALYCAADQPTDALPAVDVTDAQSIDVAFALAHIDTLKIANRRSDAVTVALTIALALCTAESQPFENTDIDSYDVSFASAEQTAHEGTDKLSIDDTDAQSIALSDHGAAIDRTDARTDAKSDGVPDAFTVDGTDDCATDHEPDDADFKSDARANDGKAHRAAVEFADQNTDKLSDSDSEQIADDESVARADQITDEESLAHSERRAIESALKVTDQITVDLAVKGTIAHSFDIADAESEHIAVKGSDAVSELITDGASVTSTEHFADAQSLIVADITADADIALRGPKRRLSVPTRFAVHYRVRL